MFNLSELRISGDDRGLRSDSGRYRERIGVGHRERGDGEVGEERGTEETHGRSQILDVV